MPQDARAAQNETRVATRSALHYNALLVDDQVTFRIPKELARALIRSAQMRGVPKSQLLREALREYLGHRSAAPDRATILERLEAYRGIASLDHAAIEADPVARQIYEHNWRE